MSEVSKNEYFGLSNLNYRFRKGEINPSELLEYYLNNIAKNNPKINAFQTVYADSARRAGRECDFAFNSGSRIGPFHGIPFALKDICELEGQITTGGSALFIERKSRQTALIAARLLNAGGILIGKTKTVEFAFGGWGTNQKMGTPKNPWDEENHRVCGG